MRLETGDLLRLSAFGDKEIVRRFVGRRGGRVLVCSEFEYEAATKGGRKPECIAFSYDELIAVEPADKAAK